MRTISRIGFRCVRFSIAAGSQSVPTCWSSAKSFRFCRSLFSFKELLCGAVLVSGAQSYAHCHTSGDHPGSKAALFRPDLEQIAEHNFDRDIEIEVEPDKEHLEEGRRSRWMNIRIFEEDTALGAKLLGYGISCCNVVVYITYLVGRYMASASTPNPAVLDFLLKHFTLSLGRVKSGQWYVLVTNNFCHHSSWHLVGNSLATMVGIDLCSSFLDFKQIASLFVGSGVLGGVVSIQLSSYYRAARYRGLIAGGSGGIYALFNFYAFARKKDLSFSQLDIIDALNMFVILREVYGLGIYLRHGYRATFLSKPVNHVAHLTGAVVGIAAFAASEATRRVEAQSSRSVISFSTCSSSIQDER